MKKLFLLTGLLFFAAALHAQNLTGLYTGTLFNDTTKLTQNYELALKDDGNKITGTSYTTFVLDDKYYFGLRTLKGFKKDGKLILEEQDLLENNFPVKPPKDIKRMAVIPLNADGEIELLNGMWQTNRTKKFAPVTGLINLRKDDDSLKSALIAYLKERNPVQYQRDLAIAKQKATPPQVIEEKRSIDVKAVPVLTTPEKTTIPKTDTLSTAIAKQEPKQNKDVAVLPKQEVKKEVVAAPPKQEEETWDAPVSKTRPAQNTVTKTTPPKTTTPVNTNPVTEKPKEEKPAVVILSNPVTKPEVADTKKGRGKNKNEVVATPVKPFGERETKIMHTVVVTADSLTLSLYDNGVVDGDVVSVYVNGENIIQSVKLTGSAFRKTIAAPKDESAFEIKLVAENLGSLPPNTGLLIIQDKEARYHVNFSADMDTNAGIIIRKSK